jgi:hypothetical protein
MVYAKRLLAKRRRPAIIIGAVLVIVVVAGTIGILSAALASYAIYAAAGVLLVGIAALDLSLIPVLALPATLLVERVGGVLSISDLVLAIASVVALLMLRGRGSMSLQPMLWAGVTYLAFLVPTLILNRYSANAIEWVHELALVLGSLVVGFVIGREGKARLALSVYVLICAGIGVVAVLDAGLVLAQTGAFQPVFLGDLHKNTIGGMLAVATVIAWARPVWTGWTRRFANTAVILCAAGVFASQSRQGLIGAVVGIIILSLRPRLRGGKRGKLIWLISIPVVVIVAIEVNQQLASGNQFNSANQRLEWFTDSVRIWQTSPVFGVGLRWWYTSRFSVSFQPPNAEFEMLTSAGIVGVVAFLLLFAVAAWHLSRLDPIYGSVALAVVATRFTQAQFDIYWVAGQASVLWIVAGIAYGVRERDRVSALGESAVDGARALRVRLGARRIP